MFLQTDTLLLKKEGNTSGTFEFDAEFGECLLHALALPLPHEAVVDVDGDHLVLIQSFIKQSCTHCGVHTTA